MSITICLAPANTIAYPNGGGHLWVYLQWALSLRALGCRVIWLEGVDLDDRDTSAAARRRRRAGDARTCAAKLRARLRPFGFADALALFAINGEALPDDLAVHHIDLDTAASADLLLNLWHSQPAAVVKRFRRSALIDTDPALSQVLVTTGEIPLGAPRHLLQHRRDRRHAVGSLS